MLAQLLTFRPVRRGTVWDRRWVIPVFGLTEGNAAWTAALRKALAPFRERRNGSGTASRQLRQPEMRRALSKDMCRQSPCYCLGKGSPQWRVTQRSLAAR
jgi:hypothetical protein